MNKRVSKLRRLFAKNKIDAIFITQAENRRYLSGFDGTAGYLFITPEKAVLATDFRYTEQAAREAPEFEILRIGGNMADWFPALVADSGVKRLGFEAAEVTFSFHRQLQDALKKKGVTAKLVPVTNGLVESLRAMKEPGEIELISKASAITDAAFNEVAASIKAGMTEKQVAWELEKNHAGKRQPGAALRDYRCLRAERRPAPPQAIRPRYQGRRAGGHRHGGESRRICHRPVPHRLRRHGLTLNLKRYTILFSKRRRRRYRKIRDGMTGHEADDIAREIIKKAGYGEAFGHSLGHGVGLAEHESPRLGPGSKDILSEGMVFTIEPGIYLSGWGGVRIEDTVVMEKGKVRPITRAQ